MKKMVLILVFCFISSILMGKTLLPEIECAYELLGILRELIVCFEEDSFIGELTYKIGL